MCVQWSYVYIYTCTVYVVHIGMRSVLYWSRNCGTDMCTHIHVLYQLVHVHTLLQYMYNNNSVIMLCTVPNSRRGHELYMYIHVWG